MVYVHFHIKHLNLSENTHNTHNTHRMQWEIAIYEWAKRNAEFIRACNFANAKGAHLNQSQSEQKELGCVQFLYHFWIKSSLTRD